MEPVYGGRVHHGPDGTGSRCPDSTRLADPEPRVATRLGRPAMGSCHSIGMRRDARYSLMNDASTLVSPGGFSLGIWTKREQSANRPACRFLSSSMSRALSMAFQGSVGRS